MSQPQPVQIKIQGNPTVAQNRPNVVQVINRIPSTVSTAQPGVSSQRFASPVAVRPINATQGLNSSVQYTQNIEEMSQEFGNQQIFQTPLQVQYNYPGTGAINLPLGPSGTFMAAPGFGGGNSGRKQCNCTKSNCLKLYCECFAQGQLCQNCNCTNCMNNLAHEEERRRAVKMTLERNPTAFNPKIGRGEGERKHTKGCNCKRSSCLKNYCECYEAKISCSSLCRCHGCQNTEDSIERRSLLRLSALGSLKSKHNNSYKKHLSVPPQETLPHSFFTWETIEAMVGCMLAQAEDAEQRDLPLPDQERSILEEFGRSIERVIKAASKAQVRPMGSSLMHTDPNTGLPLDEDRHHIHDRVGRGAQSGSEIHHRGHLIRHASDDEEYMDEEDVQAGVAGLDVEGHPDDDTGAYIGEESDDLVATTARAHRSRPPLRPRHIADDDLEMSGTAAVGSQRKPRSGSRGLSNMMDNLHMAPPTGSTRSGRRHIPSRRFQDEDEY